MISILIMIMTFSLMKLLVENSLLLILMIMEVVSISSFFLLLTLNPEILSLTSCSVTMLTIMVSESVLSLTIFISLMRSSGQDKISSLSLKL